MEADQPHIGVFPVARASESIHLARPFHSFFPTMLFAFLGSPDQPEEEGFLETSLEVNTAQPAVSRWEESCTCNGDSEAPPDGQVLRCHSEAASASDTGRCPRLGDG